MTLTLNQQSQQKHHYRVHLAPAPRQLAGSEPPGDPGNELAGDRASAGVAELGHEVDNLAGEGIVVEAGEGVDEGVDEESGVEAEEVAEEGGGGEGEGELGEGVGEVEGGGGRGGEEVGEAEEADGEGVWWWG